MRFISHIVLKLTIIALCAVPLLGAVTHATPVSLTTIESATVPVAYAEVIYDPSTGAQTGYTDASTPPDKPIDTHISWTDSAFWTSGAFLIYVTGMLLGFAGWALNGSIEYFVIDMGKFLGSGPQGSALGNSIVTSWGIIRDIINLTFVFGMIYLAFMTIVKADTSKLKHGVVQIVIAALLINFSLFFAKAIIDFGNVAAVEVYSYMQAAGHSSANQNDWATYGISGYFMNQLGLIEFFHPGTVISAGGSPTLAIGKETGFGFSLLVSLTLLIATFVFFAGAILIAIRFVTLALLLILSPVAFAGAALPGLNTEEWSRAWWKSLVSNVLFAPAYFLLLFVSMKAVNLDSLANGLSTISPTPGNIVGFFKGQGDPGSILAFMNFVLVIGFLVGSLIISKRMGAWGADSATKWGAKASFGVTAAIGRQTFGRLGNLGAESDRLKDAASRKGPRGFLARQALGISRVAQKGSFDARGIGAVQSLAKNHDVNLKLGDAKKGGYAASLEEVANKDKTYGASLGTVDDKDPRVKEYKEHLEHEEHQLADEQEYLKQLKKDFNNARKRGIASEMAQAQAAVTKQEDNIETRKKEVETWKKYVDQEKNRRQVGAAVIEERLPDTYRKLGLDIGIAQEGIRVMQKEYNDTKSTDALKKIKELQAQIKKAEQGRKDIYAKTRGAEVGYAGVLDSYTNDKGLVSGTAALTKALLTGRTRAMYKAGAKAVRDTKKAAKKAEKKDDHGGGHDDHGGGHDDHGGGGGHGGHH